MAKPVKTINMKQFLLAVVLACLGASASAVTYTYDNLNRVVSAAYPGTGAILYTYDAAGNLLSQMPVVVPTATTTAATNISLTGATLNGNINSNGAVTTVTFDYGTSTAYGTNTAATPATVAANAGSTVSLALTGLSCSTAYHFRVNGMNSVGTTNGLDQSFTTLVCLPGAPTLNTVTFGHGSATLNFTPASSGGAATSYTASCSAAGYATHTASGTGSPITVFGLTGGVAYACSVVANDSTGSSTASAVIAVTPLPAINIIPILMLLLD